MVYGRKHNWIVVTMVLKYRVYNIIWEGFMIRKGVVQNAMLEVLYGRLCIIWLVIFRSGLCE
jgi:hypothetical protein